MGKQNSKLKNQREEGRKNGASKPDYAEGVSPPSPVKIRILNPSEYNYLKRKWRCL